MNPVALGVLLVAAVAIIGICIAARSGGLLRQSTPKQSYPPLDPTDPRVLQLSKELRALDALPIVTKEERKEWERARWVFDKKLRTVWNGIYDSLPHELEHYLDDMDIRAKEPEYAVRQREQLAVLFAPTEKEPNQSSQPPPERG